MREIKFKAEYKNEIYDVIAIFFDTKQVQIKRENCLSIHVSMADCKLFEYTGVKDATDKEVYEGASVRVSYSLTENEISKVEFKRGIFFVLRKGSYYPLSEFMYDLKDRTKDLKVIGNIYETPELLEVSK